MPGAMHLIDFGKVVMELKKSKEMREKPKKIWKEER